MGQMVHDSGEPLVKTSLAKHGFPPLGCGFWHFPQYAARREAKSLFQKTSPCKGGGGGLCPPATWDTTALVVRRWQPRTSRGQSRRCMDCPKPALTGPATAALTEAC